MGKARRRQGTGIKREGSTREVRPGSRPIRRRRLQSEGDPPRIGQRQPAIAREGKEREKRAIAVVAQIEDAREAHSRVPWFVPIAVAILALDQVSDAARYCRM